MCVVCDVLCALDQLLGAQHGESGQKPYNINVYMKVTKFVLWLIALYKFDFNFLATSLSLWWFFSLLLRRKVWIYLF